MPTPTSQVLLPYLSDLSAGSLLFVTSVLNAPANWLIVRCILAVLHGDQDARPLGQNETARALNPRKVILLSFLRSLSLWVEVGKKAGLDISSLLTNRRMIYIDGLDIYEASPSLGVTTGSLSTRSHKLKDVQDVLERALEASSLHARTETAKGNTERDSQHVSDLPVLIIDGLDFLLASQPSLTATALSQMLTTIRQHVHSTMLAVSSDGPLLHSGAALMTTPLEKEHQALVAMLSHQSQLVMQLRGLDTGAAKDISGVIRISRGGGYEDETEKKPGAEGEWLYKVSRDGSVRVWGRGG